MSSIHAVWFILEQTVGAAVHHLVKSMPPKSCWTFCNQGSVRFTNFFKDAVLQKHLLIWKSSAETKFSNICLKTSPFEILLNSLSAVNFIQWVSNIALYMLHSTSIPSIPESGKAWAATISAHFIWESCNKISRPKSFPKTVRWPTHFIQDSVMAWWRRLSASLVMFGLSPSTSV